MPTVSDWGCSPEALKATKLIVKIACIGLVVAIIYSFTLWLVIRKSSSSNEALEINSLSSIEPSGATFEERLDALDVSKLCKQCLGIDDDFIIDNITFVLKACPSHAKPTFEDLLDAICWVESDCEAGMMGDAEPIILERKVGATAEINYRAIGAYQLHKIYVDDVNRILRIWRDSLNETFRKYYASRPYDPNGIESVDFEPYTYEDRWNKKHSRFMTEVYLRYYAPLNDNLEINLEAAARIHNGGPNGYKKESTKAYWLKVKARMAARYFTKTGEPNGVR